MAESESAQRGRRGLLLTASIVSSRVVVCREVDGFGGSTMAPPLVEVVVNAESVVNETVHLIRSARVEMELITALVRQQMNKTIGEVDADVSRILKNVVVITENISQSTSSFSQPVLILIAVIVVLVFLVLLATFMLLRTRREYSKHPISVRIPRIRKKPPVPESSSPRPRPRESFRASMV